VGEPGAQFPVAQIYCVGRNYAEHAIEMGHDPDREAPFFFMKPGFALLSGGGDMTYPGLSSDVHHEVELVVALKAGGQNLSLTEARQCIYGYGIGLDMTRRDLQAEAKQKGRPWESGKTFLQAAPCSALTPITHCGEINAGSIELRVNDALVQQGNLNQMIWKIDEVISRLSALFPLQAGDLIYTGTPAGVGPINIGDELSAKIEALGELKVRMVA